MAGALEPLGGDALGHAATEVRALLVKGDHTTVESQREAGFHTGEFVRRVGGTGLLDRTVRVFGDPHAAFRSVQEAVGASNLAEHVAHEADSDGRAEAAAELGPQEGDRREAEAAETDLHHEDDGAVEELTTRDANDLGIRRHIGGRRRALAGSEDELLAGGLALEDLGPLNLLSREGVLVAEDGRFTVA